MFIPKSWEMYYSCNVDGEVYGKMNRYDKEDLFNLINGLCFKTELEVDARFVVKVLNDYIQIY